MALVGKAYGRGAEEAVPYVDMATTLIYLKEVMESDTYQSLLQAQVLWMRSAEKYCDTQTMEIGSSSIRNKLYMRCMDNQFRIRQTYLDPFVCGSGVQSGEVCESGEALFIYRRNNKDINKFVCLVRRARDEEKNYCT